jgi:hypothetical protein
MSYGVAESELLTEDRVLRRVQRGSALVRFFITQTVSLRARLCHSPIANLTVCVTKITALLQGAMSYKFRTRLDVNKEVNGNP